MSVVATDIKYYLSGGAGNADPNASLGGVISATEITSAQLENLFDNVTSAEAVAGDTNYRCLYVKNTNSTDTLTDARDFFSSLPAVTLLTMGLDPAGKNATATTIANEASAPVGVSFTEPADYAGGLALGDLAAGDFYAFWLRRIVAPGASSNPLDSVIPRVQGDTV